MQIPLQAMQNVEQCNRIRSTRKPDHKPCALRHHLKLSQCVSYLSRMFVSFLESSFSPKIPLSHYSTRLWKKRQHKHNRNLYQIVSIYACFCQNRPARTVISSRLPSLRSFFASCKIYSAASCGFDIGKAVSFSLSHAAVAPRRREHR